MIITIAGLPGSGKSTAAKELAKQLGWDHHSIGDFMREIAQDRGVSLLEISKEAEKGREIDELLDQKSAELGKTEDNFVMDSRLGWHFIPHSFKVFLKVDEEEAAKRIFSDKRSHEGENTTKEQTLENIKQRKKSEEERYMKYYNVNPDDESNYDIIIDTTELNIEDTVIEIKKAAGL